MSKLQPGGLPFGCQHLREHQSTNGSHGHAIWLWEDRGRAWWCSRVWTREGGMLTERTDAHAGIAQAQALACLWHTRNAQERIASTGGSWPPGIVIPPPVHPLLGSAAWEQIDQEVLLDVLENTGRVKDSVQPVEDGKIITYKATDQRTPVLWVHKRADGSLWFAKHQ